MKRRLALGALAGGLALGPAFAAEPANPAASGAARAVLDYFHRLGREPTPRILSGQFADFGHRANLRLLEEIHAKTGRWPGLIGVDYAAFPRGGLTFEAPNKAGIEYWKQGGLVTVSAHLYNPANPKGGGLRDPGVNLADLLAPGTETHRRWMQELDQLATGLQALLALVSGHVLCVTPLSRMTSPVAVGVTELLEQVFERAEPGETPQTRGARAAAAAGEIIENVQI
jgi:mannan endo-1,4-beta-mannosidase